MQPAHVWFPVSHQIQPSDETSLGCWIWQHSGFRLDNPCIVNLAIKFRNILQVTWLGFTWIDRKPVSIWIKNYCSIKLLKVYWGYKETFQKLWRNFMVFKKLSWNWNNVGCSRSMWLGSQLFLVLSIPYLIWHILILSTMNCKFLGWQVLHSDVFFTKSLIWFQGQVTLAPLPKPLNRYQLTWLKWRKQ